MNKISDGRAPDHRGRPILLGWRGTPLEAEGSVITGVGFSDYSLSPAAKRETLEEIMEEGGFRRPLKCVICNCRPVNLRLRNFNKLKFRGIVDRLRSSKR